MVYDLETVSGLQRHLEELLRHLGSPRFEFVGLTTSPMVQATFRSYGHPCVCRPISRYLALNYRGLLRELAATHGPPDLLHLHGFVTGVWGPIGARGVFGDLPLLHTPNSLHFRKCGSVPFFFAPGAGRFLLQGVS